MVHLFFPEIEPVFNIIKALREVRCADIKLWLPSLQKALHPALRNTTSLIPIEHNLPYDHTEFCFEWDLAKHTDYKVDFLPDEYYYWLCRKDQAKVDDFFAIVTNKHPSKVDTVAIFKDGYDTTKLPLNWYHFKCLYSLDSVFQFCVEKGAVDSILLNPERFQRVEGRKYNGAQIYKEIATGYYWYKDTFHNNGSEHLEVLDSDGVHLGEAGFLDGVIDKSKKAKGRRINL